MNTILVGALVALALYVWSRSAKTNRLPVPPGPKPVPVLGNIFDLTAKELWLRITGWSKQYGDIVYIHLLGQGLVFCNTYEVAQDLLEKKGSIYSDKPNLVMAGELCGCQNMVAFTRYGDFSRRQRKLMNTAFGISAVKRYRPQLANESILLLKRILADPQDYMGYIRRYAGGLTLQSVYGYRVETNADPLLQLGQECVDILSNKIASGGGIWPVDIFPFLQHLPTWFPGAGFKRKAAVWRAKMEEFVDKPYEMLLERVKTGTAVPCFVTTLLDEARNEKGETTDPQRDFDIRWTANSMYSASMDTTITTVQLFMLAMVLHPEVLKKAQAELDAVVGSQRLPTFEDRPNLPYLDAVMSEVLRWGVPVPLGLPHRLMEDDVYKGMHLKAGTLVFANIWNMLRNEDTWARPHEFIPERFLEPVDEATAKRRDPRPYVFGFGRRRCPGLHLIEESLWIVMATMLHTTELSVEKDDSGKPVPPVVDYNNSVFRTPAVFKCDIRPRSAQVLQLVRNAE
ncbi:cytochrome P450 [Phanerochaete sordida]|uniref:Cytochrome P450 n=1 Tax=Phanerochaete sordida TaxID=48140 RepID=A0A9P3GPZ8_9APHY|nr:cytochrome P450 [Phanerochaete sordida]